MKHLTSPQTVLAGLLLTAAVLRIAAVCVWRDNLHDDRDTYLGLAHEVAAGHGFSTPGTRPPAPTAYRPPLYPLVLSALPQQHLDLAVASLQVLLGTATVWLTTVIGRRLGFAARIAMIGGAFVAIDPLLVQYTSMVMTETLCTFLVAALLAVALQPVAEGTSARAGRQVLIGILFGLGVLCRPTLWAFGVLIIAWWLFALWRAGNSVLRTPHSALSYGWIVIAAAAVTVPWIVRNWIQLGSPIITTTHGGYTLLLGNNPAFYAEVVDQPLGTVWDGSRGPGQEAWINDVSREMKQAGIESEVDQDRWMASRAWQYIAADPLHFARACLLRFVRFWNVVPSGPAAAQVSPVLRYGTAAYYAIVFALAACGLVAQLRADAVGWVPLVLLIVSFSAVHLLYWSNVRMRAPVMPAVAVLAASTAIGRRRAG